jgi:hypothetical protein
MKTFRILGAALALLVASAALAAPQLPAKSPTRYHVCSANLSMTVDATGQLVCVLPAAGMVLKDLIIAQAVAGDGTSWVITPKRSTLAMVTTAPGFTAAAGASKVTNVSGSPLGTLSAPSGATRPVIKKTTAATGTITVGAGLAAAETVTVGGFTYTARASGAVGPYEFNIGADENADATALAALINAVANSSVIASATNAVVTITAKRSGTVGNALTLAETGNGFTVSAGTLAGGFDAASSGGDIVTVDVDTTGTYNTAATGILTLVFEPLQ